MIKKIELFFKGLFKPMPLDNDFRDYDEYWQNRGFHAPSLDRAKLISKYIKPKSKILDIGCGDGTVIDYLSKNNKPQKIVGIDISQKAVDYILGNGYEAHQIDVLSKKFIEFLKDKKFDYIIITEVLEHIQDPEKVIVAVKECFNKSVFISIPNSGFFIHRIRFLFGRFPLVFIVQHVKEHIRFWTLKDFVYWTGYHNYKIVSTIVLTGLDFKPLEFLEKFFPSLFANQILYELTLKNEKK